MAIVPGDLKYRLGGGASNTAPNSSLGGVMSTVGGGVITTAVLNNLFANVGGAEASAGSTKFRALFIRNENATLTLSAIKLWISAISPSTDTLFAISLATEGENSSIQTIANEDAVPGGQTFTSPTTKGTGLTVPDLSTDEYIGVWVRRIVSPGASAVASDGPTLRFEGDTPA